MTFKLGNQAKTWGSAALFFLVTTVLCGVIYTAACTGLAQLFFPHQANGSIIEVDGTKYGSELVGQRFTDEKHLWGRAMNPSTGTFTDAEGNDVLWYAPSNLSPAGDEFATAVQDRVEQIRAAHPEMGNKPIPSDLVTNSGSGSIRTSRRLPPNTRWTVWRGQPARARPRSATSSSNAPSSPSSVFWGMRA